jgi:hypothetical protein
MEEIRCEDVRKKLEEFRLALLYPPEKGRVERHLFYCSECMNQLAAQAALVEKVELYSFS